MHLPVACLLAFLCLASLTAQAAGDSPRTDRYGDPLPAGVVARLGTERLKMIWGRFLTFSPDGRRLAAQSPTQELRIWDVPSGKVLLRLPTPRSSGIGGRNPLVFSPDSKAIALAVPSEMQRGGKQLATVHIWEVATARELHSFGGLKGLDFNLAFSPDGRYLFAGGRQVLLPGGSPVPLVRLDLTKGGASKEYGNFYGVEYLGVSRDGKTLTAVTHNKGEWPKRSLVSWDIASGKEMGRHTVTAGMYAGRLSADGGVYAAPAVGGKTIALVDPLTGRERRQIQESDSPDLIAISADGATMTTTTWQGGIRVWDVAAVKLRTSFKTPFTRVDWTALSADGKWLALTSRTDGAVHVWDVAAGRELHSFTGHRTGPLTFAFFKDGKEIVTVNREGRSSAHFPGVGRDGRPLERNIAEWEGWSFRRWDAVAGVERAVMSRNPKGEVSHTSFSADGRLLATVIHDGAFHLWDVESGKELRSWKGPTRETTTTIFDRKGKGGKTIVKTPYPATTEPVFNPDSKTLLAGYGRKIHRWETATGRELPTFEIKEIPNQRFEQTTWCLPAPDGRKLAVWSWGSGDLFLLDNISGKVKQLVRNNRPRDRHSLAFSPDGRTLAIEVNGAVSLWEVASGRSRGRLAAPKEASGLAFSPGGLLLAVGAGPQSPLSFWDLATGEVVGRLRDNRIGGPPLVFSPDGSRLAATEYAPPNGPRMGMVDFYCPTVLVCDVAELCGKRKIAEIVNTAAPSADDLEGLWVELSGTDDARAYRAIRQLGLAGLRGAVFLKERLMGRTSDERRIARLIADLDDDLFATREKASKELEKLGVRAEPALRRALKGEASVEVRARVKRLLQRLDLPQKPSPPPELVRLRAVEALEANGSKEARQALAELAEDPSDAELAQEAKSSLARLRSRSGQP